MAGLDLVPVYLSDRRQLVSRLARHLESIFRVPVRVRPPGFDPEICYDTSRGQYNSTLFLKELLGMSTGSPSRILGITSVDLFIPILTYVFGEAQVDGTAAVASIHRLRNEAYGLPPDNDLLAQRMGKEATHELGHTHGLIHCPEAACVMHASTYVEEIDLKGPGFCDTCLQSIRTAP
jgi:archaemetzincin